MVSIFAIFSLQLSYLDIKYGEIPRHFSIFMLICLFFTHISTFATNNTPLLNSVTIPLTGTLFASIIFGFVYFATQKKMGLADIWYAIGAGFVLGSKYFIISVLIACVTAGIFFAISHFAQKKGKTEKSIPFIPFLTMGYFFSLFCYYLA